MYLRALLAAVLVAGAACGPSGSDSGDASMNRMDVSSGHDGQVSPDGSFSEE